MTKKKEDPLFWIYNTPKNDIKSIIQMIDSISPSVKYKFSVLILTSTFDLLEVIYSKKINIFQYEKRKLGDNIYSFRLSKRIKGSGRIRKSRFIISKYPMPNIYIVFTHVKNTILKDDIISFFNRFYPKIAKTFLDSDYMEKILQNLERKLKDKKIRITKISSKSRITSKDAKKDFESDLKWTDLSYEEMFKRVEENDELIKNIYFTLIESNTLNYNKSKNYPVIKCQLSRDGIFKCNKNLKIFYDTVINDIANKASSNLNLLSNRERLAKDNLKPNPIIIEYKIDLFKDKGQNIRLVEALQEITNTGLSVYHSNPYLHCSYIDFRDGSSYDIWVLSNNKITIVPQMRSTYASLERLCNHIFIGLREGKIKNYVR